MIAAEHAQGRADMLSRRRLLHRTLVSTAALAGAPLATFANIVPSAPAGRTALVIGNDRYRQNPLSNAVNDARAMATLLKQAGFTVDLRLNATRAQMAAAIDTLGKSAAGRDVGTSLFYYAGHAAQLDWRNYLLPVDGDVESAGDIRRQCIDLELLLRRLGRVKGKTALIFLDACRDDPFGPRFRPPLKGMSQYDAPPGTLLAYATAPGRVAIEVEGSPNGLYTEHLLRELAVKGVRIEDALKRVRLNVRLASNGMQVPWESTSLEGDVYLFPAQRLSEADLERQVREELANWNRIKASSDVNDWISHLRRFPNGKFAEVAQVRLRQMLATVDPPRLSAGPALLLGPNRPVPARFKGSGNPNSAGTYAFRPIWTPGDEYEFHDLDLYSGVRQSTYKAVVKRVSAAENVVEFADGTVLDLMGGVRKEGQRRQFSPPLQVNPAQLQVGYKWASRFEQTGDVLGTGDYQFRIIGREMVKVPAGLFSAFKIVGEGFFVGQSIKLTRWVVPGINFPVRREIRQRGLARVLVSAKQAVSN
jgi:hypothetical protein